MAGVDIFHYRPGHSFLHRIDPRFKIGSLIFFSVAVAAGKSAAGFLILSIILAVLFVISGQELRRLCHELRLFGLLTLAIIAVYAFSIPGHPLLLSVPGLSWEGLVSGSVYAWKIGLVLVMGLLLTGTTAPEQIQEAITSILRPFPWIPGARIGTMISLTFVMTPLVLDQTAEMLEAQSARNVSLRKNPVYRIRCLAIPLLSKAIGRAGRLAEAMEARCYSELRTGTGFKSTFADWLFLFFSMGVCLLAVWI